MSARERLAEALMNPGLVGLNDEEAAELIDAVLQEHTAEVFETLVNYLRSSPILARSGEEPTT